MTAVQPSFKTKYYHKRIGHLLRIERGRPLGTRKEPELVALDVVPGVEPSPKPPVRIYLGTEPAQHRAERIFVWSILQVRDPARRYEIYLMKDLEGFDRTKWKTGFTAYRYAIPDLAGKTGRAIYNDVDQIYLTDPAELFDLDMQGAGQMCITEKETAVMLLDCEKMAKLWHREDAERGERHKFFRHRVQAIDGMWRQLSGLWNSRDHEYEPGVSKLLHYTTLQMQPWRPFPRVLRYKENPNGQIWFEMERAADAAGFTLFTEERPSQRYRDMVEMYKTMHEQGSPDVGRPPEKTFSGKSLIEHVGPIANLIKLTGATTLLDYGSGKALYYEPYPGEAADSRFKSQKEWGDTKVTCYDPGYEPYAGPIEQSYDGVICTDVLEHITEEDIPWVLDKLFQHARHFVYAVAACYPAKKFLPDGQNAHCTIQPPEWWREQLDAAARRNPGKQWTLCAQLKGKFGKSDRVFRG
ncbi:MAG TPA: hypothetical protein EYH07_13560 [Kiloniellaceae bacterium]|nr:hypothetical protein [Kiloniellaceae bacterium]HIP79473.1 hypothetical protein [Kiloniellaceae bacterium]